MTTIWESVGNTPLLKLQTLSERTGCHIYAKAEFMNPGGSIKDRAAKGLISAAEAKGLLKPGSTIIEGTAGNTGIGLAVLGFARGYKVVVTMPDNQAKEKYEYLEAMGVDVRKVPVVPFSNPAHFIHQAKALAETHEVTTGEELWAQTQGQVDVLIAAVGSSGTLSGCSRALKRHKPAVKVVLADPLGSGMYAQFTRGVVESTGSSFTEGIGIMRVTENFRRAQIDEAVQVDDQQMIEMLYHLARHEGLVVGTSAALNARAAYNYAYQHQGQGLTIVTFLCDSGARYASKAFNSDFLASKGLTIRPLP
jgi:cysteine synthase